MNKKKDRIWTLIQLLNWLTQYLEEKGVGNSTKSDAELLICETFGLSRMELYLQFDKPAQEKELAALKQLIHRRLKHEPIAYITGKREFYGLELNVEQGVLIPRNETELLVEYTLKKLSENEPVETSKVLDFGTGSGAIALALATQSKKLEITALDCEPKAFECALKNIEKHRRKIETTESSVTALISDGFEKLPEKTFGWIVANPPYIDENDLPNLDAEVRLWEPQTALNGGAKGMEYYALLARQAPRYLSPKGSLILEHGYHQRTDILNEFSKTGNWQFQKALDDYSGLPRILHFSTTP